MRMRSKMFLIAIMTWLIILAAMIIGSYTVILSDYRVMEADDIKDYYARNQEAIDRLKDSLNTLIIDWAHWNDTYKFVADKNQDYITNNINITTYHDLKLNVILFYNSLGNLVYGNMYEKNDNKIFNATNAVLNYINSHKVLLKHEDVKKHTTGFIKIGSDYYLIGSFPITNSDVTAKPNGNVIMGYLLDEERLQKLATTLQVQLELITFETAMNNPALRQIVDQLQNGAKFKAIPRNNAIIDIYTYLTDIEGEPIGIFHTTMDRSVYQEGMKTINKYIVVVILIGLIVLLLVEFALKFIILDRIYTYKSQLTDITKARDFSKSIFMTGKDEISEMVESSNELLRVINENERKLTQLIDVQSKDIAERKENEKKLANLNQQMTLSLTKIQLNEKKLSEVNEKMASMVNELKQREHEMKLINKMNEMLQFCQDSAELYSIISLAAKDLFPDIEFEFAIFNKSTKQLEIAGQDKETHILKSSFDPDACWGVRAGHIYEVDDPKTNVICDHFKWQPPGGYICIPLVVGNEFIGLINQTAAENKIIDKNQQQLAITFSDVVKLSLANIKLRETLSQ